MTVSVNTTGLDKSAILMYFLLHKHIEISINNTLYNMVAPNNTYYNAYKRIYVRSRLYQLR